jgi:signal transduction histidine kinase
MIPPLKAQPAPADTPGGTRWRSMTPDPDGFDEAARLAELHESGLLDTEAEQAYDDIAYLASRICETPIALVSLVDHDRQWFKSKVGLSVSETSRDVAFCAHAIRTPAELFVVADATCDARFADNPLVLGDPNIRFYAGAPLTTANGNALGMLCVIDRVPRQLDPAQIASLRALSRMVMAQIELRAARDQAQAADRAKMLFLANMSHEIRTPLNAILGLSELMSMEAYGPLGDGRYREYAQDINASGDHLLSLINDVLDLARIEADELNLLETTFDLAEAIGAVARMVSVHADSRQLTVDLRLPSDLGAAYADERRIKQVIINLVTNAIKFTPEGGVITVTAARTVRGGLRVEVSDTGCGMSAGDLEIALSAYGQVGHGAAAGGTGLGLPISKRLVEAHGGTFSLQSTPGLGTTAIIVLPPSRTTTLAA